MKKRWDAEATRRLNKSRDPSESRNWEDVSTGVQGGHKENQDLQISPDKPPSAGPTPRAASRHQQTSNHLLVMEDGWSLEKELAGTGVKRG